MKVVITSIQLRGPFKFFILSKKALEIIRQLRASECIQFKKKGIWTKHFTMTSWDSDEALKNFVQTGAHQNAMRMSATIAKEIKTITIETRQMPSWSEAMVMLEDGKTLRY